MSALAPIHPIDRLAPQDKWDIYFSRVVDLATVSGLIDPDPCTEVGHFAFSRHYIVGRDLDRHLQTAVREFEGKYPEMVAARQTNQNHVFANARNDFFEMADEEKIRDLILIGASYRVWPTGTSFTLTYPWDRDGKGRMVTFRDDLPDFMKRRIFTILRKAGKLQNGSIFHPR